MIWLELRVPRLGKSNSTGAKNVKGGEVRTVTQATIKLIRIGAAPLLPPDRLPGSPSGQTCAVNEGILRQDRCSSRQEDSG